MPLRTRKPEIAVKLHGSRYFVRERDGKYVVVEKTLDRSQSLTHCLETVVEAFDSEAEAERLARKMGVAIE